MRHLWLQLCTMISFHRMGTYIQHHDVDFGNREDCGINYMCPYKPFTLQHMITTRRSGTPGLPRPPRKAYLLYENKNTGHRLVGERRPMQWITLGQSWSGQSPRASSKKVRMEQVFLSQHCSISLLTVKNEKDFPLPSSQRLPKPERSP
jgi:hypothetical protein